MSGIAVRPAAAADREAIERIVEAAYARYVERMAGQKPAPMLDDYAGRIARGEAYVAVSAGAPAQPLGVVVLVDQPDGLLLDNIAVAPAAAGSGVGRRLFAFAEGEARRRGHGLLRLYTNVAMYENVALYDRAGWRRTGKRREDGYERIHFEKYVG